MIYYFYPTDVRRHCSGRPPKWCWISTASFIQLSTFFFHFHLYTLFFFSSLPHLHIHNGSQSTPAPLPPPLISPTTRRHSFRPLCPASTHTQLSLLFPPRPPPSIPMPFMFLHSPSAFKPLPPLYALPLLPHLQLWITSRSI